MPLLDWLNKAQSVKAAGEASIRLLCNRTEEMVGDLWQRKQQGSGIFLMVVKRDDQGRDIYSQLKAAIA